MQEELGAAVARLNAGEQIAPVEAFLIERIWEVFNSVAPVREHSIGFDLGAMAGSDPRFATLNADQRIAIIVRYQMLDALIKRGVVECYMEDAKLRQKVFAAAASLPCDKNDLGEAFWLKRLHESPPDLTEKAREEARQADYDPDHPQLGEKFIVWMRDQ